MNAPREMTSWPLPSGRRGTPRHGSGERDVYLIKADAGCHELWHKVFGGPYMDVGRSVAQTSDGGYVVLGETDR